jgi:glycine hydroxymethyltransferase
MCKAEHAKDLDRNVFPGIQGGPLMHVIAGKAVCFGEALKPDYRLYIQNVVDNARTLAEALMSAGLRLVSGGTDNHLMLLDVTTLGIGGKVAEAALGAAGITVNKNMIPYDERKPMDPSGIRIGTPALTSRNMGATEMKKIADWIVQVLKAPDDADLHSQIRAEIFDLCDQFPVPAAALVDVDGVD